MVEWALILFFASGSLSSGCSPSYGCPTHYEVIPGFDSRDRCEKAVEVIPGSNRHTCVQTKGPDHG